MSYLQIAAEMDCPVGTVKTWVHRARSSVIRILRQREVLAGSEISGSEERQSLHEVNARNLPAQPLQQSRRLDSETAITR